MVSDTDYELPEGWAVERISVLFDSWGGGTPSTTRSDYWKEGSIPWVSSKDVKRWRISAGALFVTDRAVKDKNLRVCPAGAVLVVVRSGILAHTLPVAIAESNVVINQDLKAFFSYTPELNEWLALSLRANARSILNRNRKDGTTVHSVEYDQLKSLLLPVPPLSEQKRILDKSDMMLRQIGTLRSEVIGLFELLFDASSAPQPGAMTPDKLTQSILTKAFRGELVPTEAELARQEGRKYEPASVLLERIRAERIKNSRDASTVRKINARNGSRAKC